MLSIALAAVPEVAAGPDLAAGAAEVEAPIQRVEVFSDRARITRRGRTSLPAGIHALRLPDLPGGVWLDTLRADATGARILRVEATPVERERVSIDEVEALLTGLEARADEVARLDADLAAVEAQLGLLGGLEPAAPIPEKDRPRPLSWDVGAWGKSLDFLSKTRAGLAEERRALSRARKAAAQSLEREQREVARMGLGALSEQRVQVLLLVDAKGGPATVELGYDAPGAQWKPAYDLRYDPRADRVALERYAAVRQSTGEAWPQVALDLSTAMPGRDIAIPELLTWTLGEAKEFVPSPRAQRRPPAPPRYAPPQPAAALEAKEKQARLALLQERLQALARLAKADVQQAGWYEQAVELDFEDDTVGGALMAPSGANLQTRSSRKKRARAIESVPSVAPPAPSMPAPRDDVAVESVLGAAPGSSASVRRTPLDLFESQPARGARLSDPTLPAMLTGGFEHVFSAKTKMTVPSTNEALRAPLGARRFEVRTFYEATPALAEHAYLKASVVNGGERPILRGPVTIFVGGRFAGEGQLDTTGPGGTLELPFGADEDVKLERTVVPSTETKGVFSKDEVTTYRVIMEVASFKKRPITVLLREPLPRSRNDEVKVERVKTTPEPARPADDDGILTWEIDVAPGGTRTVELVYRVTRPDGWQLWQR